MNKFFFIGNLTRDPEQTTTASGVNLTRMSIAVNRAYTNANGERVADFFDITAWRQLADICGRYLKKGSKISVMGSVQRRQYDDKDGNKRTSYDFVAEDIEFLSAKVQSGDSQVQSSGASGGGSPLKPADEDLPF